MNLCDDVCMTTTAAQQALYQQAAALRAQGQTFNQIAQALGLNSGGHARYCVNRALGIPHRTGRGTTRQAQAWLQRQFGVEVEHCNVSTTTSAAAMRAAGLDARAENYTHAIVPWWKCTTDASCGYEAVSPILHGAEGFENLRTAMQAIRTVGGTVNRSTGMHVHFDMAGLDGAAIARFVGFYAAAQNVINEMMPPSRRHNAFCEMLPSDERVQIIESFTTARRSPQFCSGCGRGRCHHRYRTINVHSFPLYGTVEVRQHQGTLNGSKAQAWITLNLAMIEIARLDRIADVDLTSVSTFVDSVAAIVGSGMTARVRTALKARAGVSV